MTDINVEGWTIARAYGLGRSCAARREVLTAPDFNQLFGVRPEEAEALAESFWQGVRDQRADDRLNMENW